MSLQAQQKHSPVACTLGSYHIVLESSRWLFYATLILLRLAMKLLLLKLLKRNENSVPRSKATLICREA